MGPDPRPLLNSNPTLLTIAMSLVPTCSKIKSTCSGTDLETGTVCVSSKHCESVTRFEFTSNGECDYGGKVVHNKILYIRGRKKKTVLTGRDSNYIHYIFYKQQL